MSIPAILNPQRDFSAGEIDISAIRRDDADIHKAAARKLLNCETILAGGFTRRPGTRLDFFGGPYFDRIEPVVGLIFDIEFRAGEFRAHGASGAVQTLVAPWNADQLTRLDWALYESKLIVVEQTMRPQVIECDQNGTWSITPFAFAVGSTGMLRQPFYRFALKGIFMRIGDSDLGDSHATVFHVWDGNTVVPVDILTPQMIGTEYKWGGRRLRLTDFISPSSATFLNLEQLPPQFIVYTDTVSGFRPGDVIAGASTGAQAIMLGLLTGATGFTVVMLKRYIGFNAEPIASPDGIANVTSATLVTNKPSMALWEEAFMTDYRGWPGSVSVDRQRLIFCDFRQLPGAFVESAIGQFDDFEITGDADGAIFEVAPQRERVRHVLGGADQFIFTNQSVYYIPISAQNPLAPGSIEFRAIGTGGCSGIKPVSSLSSLIFMSADNMRLMALRQTGQTAQPYVLDHLSKYHSQLIRSPVDVVVSYGQDLDSGETLYVINGDGTLTRGRYDPGADFVGFLPWETNGRYRSAAALGRVTKLCVERDLPGGAVATAVETVDYSVTLDSVVRTSNIEGGAALVMFQGQTLERIVDGVYGGPALIGAGGLVAGRSGPGAAQFGYGFTLHMKPFAANFDKGESSKQRLRRRKVKKYAVTVQDTGPFRVNRTDHAGYEIGDDLGKAPPLRSKTFTGSAQGRSYDPTIDLIQELPYPLKIVELAMEVTA